MIRTTESAQHWRIRMLPKDLGVALWRVVVRAVILLILGTALTMLGTPVSVILAYYAVFFVFACMLLTERWTVIAGAASHLLLRRRDLA